MADIETPRWRDKGRIGNLMSRLYRHAEGEIEMTATQIRAAEAYLKKTLPDVQSVTLKGDAENPLSMVSRIERVLVDPKAE